MATVLKFSVAKSTDFTYLIFTDSTGNKPTPSDGYGAPDIVTSAVTTVTVSIVFPGTTTAVVSPNFGNIVLNTSFNLTSSMFNGLPFPDGYYQIIYLVSDGTHTFTREIDFFIEDETICCVTKGLVNLKTDKKCFTKQDLKPLVAKMFLMAADDAFYKCGLKNKASELIAKAKDFCSDCGCGCGGDC